MSNLDTDELDLLQKSVGKEWYEWSQNRSMGSIIRLPNYIGNHCSPSRQQRSPMRWPPGKSGCFFMKAKAKELYDQVGIDE